MAAFVHSEAWSPVYCPENHIPDMKIDKALLTVENDANNVDLLFSMQSKECHNVSAVSDKTVQHYCTITHSLND
jgi:hypothetical protein